MSSLSDNSLPRRAPAAGRHIYLFLALLTAAAVLVGFAPSFFLRPLLGTPDGVKPMTLPVLLHGVLFTIWIGLFTVQVALVHAGRRDLHRRLGLAGMVIVPLMLVSGLVSSISGAMRAAGPPGIDPHEFLAVPLFSLAGFTLLFGLGLARRRDPQTHKRLMLLGICAMMSAAYGRMIFLPPPVGMLLMPAFPFLFLLGWDWRTRGRPHAATMWGGLVLLVALVVPMLIWQTPTWLAFAHWLVPG